jgi:hypothetical protein
MDYLAACAIYLNEAPNLQEWIEFHRLVGVERFYLYNDNSTDDHRAVLAPYVDEGIVVLKDWSIRPGQPTGTVSTSIAMKPAGSRSSTSTSSCSHPSWCRFRRSSGNTSDGRA